MAQCLSLGHHHDHRSALHAIQAPALVTHGANDPHSMTATQRYMGALPNATLTTLDGVGYFPFEQQSEAFARTVAGLLERIAEPSGGFAEGSSNNRALSPTGT